MQRAMASGAPASSSYGANLLGGGLSGGSSSRGKGGSLASFSTSVWSPSAGSVGRREESYHLLLELCSQVRTVLSACSSPWIMYSPY